MILCLVHRETFSLDLSCRPKTIVYAVTLTRGLGRSATGFGWFVMNLMLNMTPQTKCVVFRFHAVGAREKDRGGQSEKHHRVVQCAIEMYNMFARNRGRSKQSRFENQSKTSWAGVALYVVCNNLSRGGVKNGSSDIILPRKRRETREKKDI